MEPHQHLGPGQIRDSNRSMLDAAVQENGGIPIDYGIGEDDQESLERRILQALEEVDIVLTSGGVSMGDLDFVKPLLERAGTVHFGRIRMKPGKPLTFATAVVSGRRRLLFGLPGNPVSSLVTFYLAVVPSMRKMAGLPNPRLTQLQAFLDRSLPLDPNRPEYHRARIQWEPHVNDGHGGYVAYSTGSQASSRLLSMRTANALLELPEGHGALESGTIVSALLIGEIG